MKLTELVFVFLKDEISELQRLASKNLWLVTYKLPLATRLVSWKVSACRALLIQYDQEERVLVITFTLWQRRSSLKNW